MSGPAARLRRLVLLLVTAVAACGDGAPAPRASGSDAAAPEPAAALHRRLFAEGLPYADFLARVERRVELWRELSAPGAVPAALAARARAAAEGRDWRLLIVAEDGCSDSASTVPYIAQLAESSGVLDVRIVGAAEGRTVMEQHPTPDGRAATPTVLLLDGRFEELGCWVERPAALQAWYIANRATLGDAALADQKAGWYRGDRGRDTLAEVVDMLEAAAAGRTRC